MYLAMSRLKVVSHKEVDFETAWRKRDQNIDSVKGFRKFNLFKSSINKELTLYIFHPNSQSNLYLGPPNFDGYIGLPDFEGFKVVI